MYWIEYRYDEAIPQELYYDGYQTDRDSDGQTPLMYWIKYRQNEDIPQELYYDNWQADIDVELEHN